MKGNNSITMNKATMLEAMNLWLKSEFKEPPVATNVTEVGNSNSFTITLNEKEKDIKDEVK